MSTPASVEDALSVLLGFIASELGMTATPTERWMTPEEAAEYAQVTPRAIRSWADAGMRHGGKGKTLRVKPSDVDDWLRAMAEPEPLELDATAAEEAREAFRRAHRRTGTDG